MSDARQDMLRAAASVWALDTWWLEFWSAISLLTWAMMNLFVLDHVQRHFGPLLHLAPETVWEAYAAVVSMAQGVALHGGPRWARACCAALAAWVNGALFACLLINGEIPTGHYMIQMGMNLTALRYCIMQHGQPRA